MFPKRLATSIAEMTWAAETTNDRDVCKLGPFAGFAAEDFNESVALLLSKQGK